MTPVPTQPFDVEYYFAIIDRFYALSLDFEMVGDKFFELQQAAANITEEEMDEVERHPAYASCEKKLAMIAHILEKIK